MKFTPVGFLTACLYWKFRKTWFLLKNFILQWINKFCFNFCFLFLLYLNLPSWNLHFLNIFCYWQNSFMKGNEGGNFSKAPDRQHLFLLKVRIKQKPACRNKEYNVALKHLTNDWNTLPWPMIAKMLHIGKNRKKMHV